MAAVTWKNIAPSNPSGLLSAANQAAKTMGEGISGIGTALQGGVDKKVESETNDFITDLMAAGSEEERNAMIGAANDSFLNMKNVNATNYELGEPDRAKKVFEEELAARLISDKDLAKYQSGLNIEEWNNKVANPQPTTKSSSNSSSSSSYQDPSNNDPTKSDGYFNQYLSGENTFGFGAGFGDNNRIEYADYTSDFLNYKDSETGNSIWGTTLSQDGTRENSDVTAWHVNELVQKRLLTFDDRSLIEGILPGGQKMGDNFIFTHNEQQYDFSDVKNNKNGAAEALNELIYDEIIGKPSPRKKIEVNYFKAFVKNNPELNTATGKKIFDQIYDKNIKNKNSFDQNGQVDKFFGTRPKEEIDQLIQDIVKPYSDEIAEKSEKIVSTMDYRFSIYQAEQLHKKGYENLEPLQKANYDALKAKFKGTKYESIFKKKN